MTEELLLASERSLPSVAFLDDPAADIVDRTKAVLKLLFLQPVDSIPVAVINPATCPNCDLLVPTNSRSPYCSDTCREASAFVRQFRSSVETGVILGTERQEALGQKLWYVLGGGYPRREVLVPPKVMLKVLERQSGLCEQCGAKATTIDHSGSG